MKKEYKELRRTLRARGGRYKREGEKMKKTGKENLIVRCEKCGTTEAPSFYVHRGGDTICGDCYYHYLEVFPDDFACSDFVLEREENVQAGRFKKDR